MDEELSRLRRAADAAPADVEAARRLDSALLRAGRRDEVRERYRLAFRCPLGWEDLEQGPDPSRRYCARCDREVHRVRTAAQLDRCVARGQCAAFDPQALDARIEGLIEDPAHTSASAPARPCLVDAPPERVEGPEEREPVMMGAVIRMPPDPEEAPVEAARFRARGRALLELAERRAERRARGLVGPPPEGWLRRWRRVLFGP